MEIKVQRNTFLKAITLVGGVTSAKSNTIPILGNILIETETGGNLKVIGTDLEIGISTSIPVDIIKDGSITIPSKKILEIVREIPEGEIEILVTKNNAVNIKSRKVYFKILGLAKDDYPKIPDLSPINTIEIQQSVLKNALPLTSFAVSTDETRYVLNGILMVVKGNQIRFVATDGRRMALVRQTIENKEKKDIEIIIPAKAIHELLKIAEWDGMVKISPVQNQVVFNFGDTRLVSRLIEGNFPNYEQVIPKVEKTVSNIQREDFLQALRRTALLTSTDAPALKLDFLEGKILISARSPNLGEAKEELDAEVKGDELTIGFNPNYLIDALKNLDVSQVSFALSEPDKPGLLRAGEDYLYVIMPMQLN
ncbi:MAG: DNA polymerase III subunit beta [Candidatus Omnitrophica bacterium]|nr:DNA polymerase III subunit beta [Candidatus Omnitrophota bacterium]